MSRCPASSRSLPGNARPAAYPFHPGRPGRVRALPHQPQSPDPARPPRPADTRPACEIFNRFMERLEQRTAYADELLKHEKFTFDTDERIMINRKGLPYPADLDEAKKLWRERLRFEYLQELLGKIGARKKNLAAATKKKPLAAETNALVKAAEPLKAARADAATEPGVPPPRPPRRPSRKAGARWCCHLRRTRSGLSAMQAAADEGARQGRSRRPSEAHAAEKPRRRGRSQTPRKPARPKPAARAAALTNQTAAAPPKKTDDEEIIETLSHRYHRNLRFFADWNNEDVLADLSHRAGPRVRSAFGLSRPRAVGAVFHQHEPQPVRHRRGTDFRRTAIARFAGCCPAGRRSRAS